MDRKEFIEKIGPFTSDERGNRDDSINECIADFAEQYAESVAASAKAEALALHQARCEAVEDAAKLRASLAEAVELLRRARYMSNLSGPDVVSFWDHVAALESTLVETSGYAKCEP